MNISYYEGILGRSSGFKQCQSNKILIFLTWLFRTTLISEDNDLCDTDLQVDPLPIYINYSSDRRPLIAGRMSAQMTTCTLSDVAYIALNHSIASIKICYMNCVLTDITKI